MIRDIVFDFGGVLVDLAPEEAIRRLVTLGVHDADTLLDPYLQRGIFKLLEDGTLTVNEFEQELRKTYQKDFTHEELLWAIGGFIKGVPSYKFEYIKKLRGEFRISVLSNTNPYILEIVDSPSFHKNTSLSSWVDHIYASCEMNLLKPDLEFYKEMMRRGDMDPDKTLFLDDGIANVEAARKVGIESIHVTNGEDWWEKLNSAIFC